MSATLTHDSTPSIGSAPPLADVAPKRRPMSFAPSWVALLIATDVGMFLVAALAAIEIVKHGHYVPAPADSIVVSSVIYAAFWLLIFERLGLYRRSFASSVKDELYYTAAALALGALPQFVLFTLGRVVEGQIVFSFGAKVRKSTDFCQQRSDDPLGVFIMLTI